MQSPFPLCACRMLLNFLSPDIHPEERNLSPLPGRHTCYTIHRRHFLSKKPNKNCYFFCLRLMNS